LRLNVLLGELLLTQGLLSEDELGRALSEQRETGEPLGQVVVRLGFVAENDLRRALSEQLGMPFLSPDELKPRVDQRLKELIPKDLALEHLLLPLEVQNDVLKIACARVPNVIVLDDLRKLTGCEIKTVLTSEADLKRLVEFFYSTTDITEVVTSSEFSKATESYSSGKTEGLKDLDQTIQQADAAPVVKLVDMFLKKALDDRASDIHIEPIHDRISIRYRVDGSLYELPPPPRDLHSALVSRIKILSKLDIAEKRMPQDGSFSFFYQGRKVDVRVSTIPVVSGEKVAIRILDKRAELMNVKSLGFSPEQLAIFEDKIQKPYGLIFVTGPTGSGKSTSLYAALNRRISPKINILTIEDPVEYQINGVNQVQVQSEIGLTFAAGLRAFLRQDPDVILVGEVRDQETAEICIRAALTGHLVMSTLHTNDAASAVTRLVDIGIKPYLVAGSLLLIVAQRLVRNLCSECKKPDLIDAKIKTDFGITAHTIYKANEKGCKACRNIGYWGRTAIYELLPIDEDMRRAIAKGGDLEELRGIQKQKKYGTLFQSGMTRVNEGTTSLEEVMSIAYV